MDDSTTDVYFVERNAAVNDHRTPTTLRPTFTPTTRTPTYLPPTTMPTGTRVTYGGPATYAGPAQFGPQAFWGSSQPVYVQPPSWGWGGQPGTLGGLFAGLHGINLGSLVDMVAQGFAAIRSLPTPPTSSGDSGTDVANLILYQQALADHGKTDEQIRTAAHILAKLLGA
jgi:hypothetical protein